MADYVKAVLADMNIDGQEWNLFDGRGTIEYDGKTYQGVGFVSEVRPAVETPESTPKGIEIVMDALDENILSLAIADNFQHGEIKLLALTFDYPGYVFRKAFTLFLGYISHMKVAHDYATRLGTITVVCYTEMQTQALSPSLRYTSESQRVRDPTDTSMDRLPSNPNTEVIWGRGTIRG